MERALTDLIRRDLGKKIVLLTGPRQSGKTWLSTHLNIRTDYLSYDDSDHRKIIREKTWDRHADLVVLDELHKMRDWKSFLKGVYDVEGMPPALLVTGSARLDIHRKTGESMAGRFFRYRLHPFDVKELTDRMEPSDILERMLSVGGFPEPFLDNDPSYYNRWKRTHLDAILRQDLLDLVTVSDLHSLGLLTDLLKERVGSPVSYASPARDLERDPKTIKRWLALLEDMYVVFAVRPYHRNIARAVLKEPKYYFYDTGQVVDRPGARLENAVAGSLLKTVQYEEERDGRVRVLNYVRTRDGREIDFAIVQEGVVTHLIEVKYSDESLSRSFRSFRDFFPGSRRVQLSGTTQRARTWPTGEELRPAADFLAELDLGR